MDIHGQKGVTKVAKRSTNGSQGKTGSSLMNQIWFFLIGVSIMLAGFNGTMDRITKASFESAKSGVDLALGLIGAMALWLGLVKVAEAGGLMDLIARGIRPVMRWLFPDVPATDPAMSAMVLNMSANAMGLGNAATPLGIRAMMALNRLNPCPGVATDAMCLFLAINTSNVTLLPLGVIGVRAAAGAAEPAAILIPTILATSCSTLVAVIAAKILKRKWQALAVEVSGSSQASSINPTEEQQASMPVPGPENKAPGFEPTRALLVLIGLIFLLLMAGYRMFSGTMAVGELSHWLVPLLILGLVGYGYAKGVPVYEVAIDGAKEGFKVAVRLIPFLVMILVAVGMFRASGAFKLMASLLRPLTDLAGIPPEVIPVALLRPLSGSGAFGLMSEITARDPNGFAAFLAATIQGSTETTFYVMAVYFGAVGIYKARYAIAAALMADLAGFLAAVFFCKLLY